MKTRKWFGLLVVVFLALPALASAVSVGQAAPEFSLKTMDGSDFSVKGASENKPVMMVFWATWCPVCREEIPGVREVYARFAPKGLRVIAVNVGVNDSVKRMEKYVGRYDIPYPVAFDRGSKVTRRFGVQGTPTVIIVDAKGIVRYRSAALPEDLEEHFDGLMN